MKRSTLFLLLFIVLVSCKQALPSILDKFIETKDKMAVPFPNTNPISEQDLDLLMATNEVNEPVYNVAHHYFYGYKKKLNEQFYLLSIKDTYMPTYRFTNYLTNWEDVYLCIYDVSENKVVSKLRIKSSDPIATFCEEENNIYTLTSDYGLFLCGGLDCEHIERERKRVTHTYKIIDNHFRLVDNREKKK
ncbi:hypothetical protein [Xanthocytophaga flava]|uniref:hypothetical protein n=1 Tax=Xanthocytophaga flava TaxID=3048013 RepID=UPI0028D6AB30|nr:hypothetical protein [Xanthocytophaga flavus]MDJ1466931.1 hypothetical protein [Xanthocytophaga flavus]